MSIRIMKIMCFIFCIGMLGALFADTIPGGDVSGTWYAANSPYYVMGSITVPAGDTLTIEPGVWVILMNQYLLTANGLLEAVGTEADSIRFSPVSRWNGISLNGPGPYTLSYCTFNNMDGGVREYLNSAGNAVISHCRFTSNAPAINWISAGTGDLRIMDCLFRQNLGSPGASIRAISHDGLMEVSGCLFSGNGGATPSGAAIFDSSRTGVLRVTTSVFTNNVAGQGAAIYCSGSDSVVVDNCVFNANRAMLGGAYLGGGAFCLHNTSLDVSRCLFYDNDAQYGAFGDAINAYGHGSYAIDHCTFYGYVPNGQDIMIFVYGSDTLSSIAFTNSIFSYSARTMYLDSLINVSVKYSDFYGNISNVEPPGQVPPGFDVPDTVNYNGDSCDVYYNIFLNPMYVDTVNHDFHLLSGSPCIDAGDPSFAYDPDATITDIGAYWYDQGTAVAESPVIKITAERGSIGATIISGPLVLPRGKSCRVFDICGRTVTPAQMKPGVYFIEIDGEISQKVIKVR